MLLYTFTTDGGDREDGNVYCAQHMLVDVPESQFNVVSKIIGDFLGDPKCYVNSSDSRAKYCNPTSVIAELKVHGFTAYEVEDTKIILSREG